MKSAASIARVFAAATLVALAGSTVAAQQSYPSKPIRFISRNAPGGGTSIVARLVGQKLTESWGQPVIVDNRPGGNTNIGNEALVKAPPDGYTIMITGVTHVLVPLLLPSPYDVIDDFAPVTTLTSGEFVLVLHPSVRANSLIELIALARTSPGKLNYASTGGGSIQHLGNEWFNVLAGVKMQHIPYKGSAPAVTDLLGGQVQLFFSPPISVISHIKVGKLKAIATTGQARLSALPQVPTVTEAGLPGFDLRTWYGVFAPAATSKAIIDRLASEMGRIVAMPDIREKLLSQGLESFVSTPDQFAMLLKSDMAK